MFVECFFLVRFLERSRGAGGRSSEEEGASSSSSWSVVKERRGVDFLLVDFFLREVPNIILLDCPGRDFMDRV